MKYDVTTIVVNGSNELGTLDEVTSKKLAEFERKLKKLKQAEEDIKAKLCEEMGAKFIKKIDNDYLSITYVEPTYKETFDSKTFRAEHPDLYDEYIKMSDVKASVRVKLK